MANQGGGHTSSSGMIREYRKGNWTVNETMVLIEAKRMDDERRMKRSSDPNEPRNKPAELRWKWVEDYCWRKGCLRSQNQCNDKWDNLMRDYKKVRDYERRVISSSSGSHERSSSAAAAAAGEATTTSTGGDQMLSSYWKLEKSERKEKNLPSNMLLQIYEALFEVVERRSSSSAGGQSQTSPSLMLSSSMAAAGVSGVSAAAVATATATAASTNPNISYALELPPVPPPSTASISTSTNPSLLHQYHPSILPPLLQHPTESVPIIGAGLPLPPPLPRPQSPSSPPPAAQAQAQAQPLPFPFQYSQAPLPTVDCDTSDEYSDSPAKRRRRSVGGGGGEGTSGTASGSSRLHEVGSAISKSATIIAEAIQACEESEERRHRDLLSLHERRLKIEESKNEVNRQGINGLVDAINKLASSILALASSHNKNHHSQAPPPSPK